MTSDNGLPCRSANATSYYKGDDALWVKLVSDGDKGPITGASVQVKCDVRLTYDRKPPRAQL